MNQNNLTFMHKIGFGRKKEWEEKCNYNLQK